MQRDVVEERCGGL